MKFAIIEIGSNNTKTHVYENEKVIYDNNTTIEFKKNYVKENKIYDGDLEKLEKVISKALEYTNDVHIYGCSIFRNLSLKELKIVNNDLKKKYNLEIEVVSQEDEAYYTAMGCYSNINYDKNICVFIGGGGSIELLFIKNKKVIGKKYYDFGVVDITNQFPSLKEDKAVCTFEEVQKYASNLLGDIKENADILILAGGDHLYWYNNAGYKLYKNTLYDEENQKYLIDINTSDEYDRDALLTSLDAIKDRSDNPLWFDGSRAMKVITNIISHKINAKYIIPTKINMENGIKVKLISKEEI